MTFKRSLIGAALALILAAPAAHAEAGKITFGLQGGLGVPTGDFADVGAIGFNGGVFGDYGVNDNFCIGLDFIYHYHGLDSDFKDALKSVPTDDVDGNWQLLQFGGHGTLKLAPQSTSFSPWIRGGAGIYNVRGELEINGVKGDDSESKFGINGAVGADFPLGDQMWLGGEGAFHNIFVDDESLSLFTIALRLTFRTAN